MHLVSPFSRYNAAGHVRREGVPDKNDLAFDRGFAGFRWLDRTGLLKG